MSPEKIAEIIRLAKVLEESNKAFAQSMADGINVQGSLANLMGEYGNMVHYVKMLDFIPSRPSRRVRNHNPSMIMMHKDFFHNLTINERTLKHIRKINPEYAQANLTLSAKDLIVSRIYKLIGRAIDNLRDRLKSKDEVVILQFENEDRYVYSGRDPKQPRVLKVSNGYFIYIGRLYVCNPDDQYIQEVTGILNRYFPSKRDDDGLLQFDFTGFFPNGYTAQSGNCIYNSAYRTVREIDPE